MCDSHERLERLLAEANVSKIVYSLVMPETESVKKEMMYARAAVLTTRDVDESDIAAYWLKRIYSQGKEWTKIWTNPKGELAEVPREGVSRLLKLRWSTSENDARRSNAKGRWTNIFNGCRRKRSRAERAFRVIRKPKRSAKATCGTRLFTSTVSRESARRPKRISLT
jgi:hypothetical protein